MTNPFDLDQPNQITSILDAMDYKPRIVQCIQAHNEESLIRECMLQLYNKVDQILVLEGAVKNRPNATDDGHSTDRTIEVIKKVMSEEDPDNKFLFIQISRPWNDLEEMKNVFFQYMKEGDWMLITDVDEFIHPETVDLLRRAISVEPWATEFVPMFYHFWRDTKHIRKPSGSWGVQHQRFIKFQPGLHYRTHPVATDKDGVCTYFDPKYLMRRFILPGFEIFHYSYCKPNQLEEINRKKEFYSKELGQQKHAHVGAYERGGQTDEFTNFTEPIDTVLLFDKKHPLILDNHPIMSYKEEFYKDKQIKGWKEVEPYSLERVPLIWIWASENRKPYDKLYNIVNIWVDL